jgi:soluble lytic murein transglycosylase-like protein
MSQRLKQKLPDESRRLEWLRFIHREAARAKLPPELVLSVIQIESNFDRFAISEAGARGLMQVMPFWLKELGRADDNLFDVQTNLRFGCTILRYYLDMEKGDTVRALARYNGSLGSNRYPNLVFAALRNKWYR